MFLRFLGVSFQRVLHRFSLSLTLSQTGMFDDLGFLLDLGFWASQDRLAASVRAVTISLCMTSGASQLEMAMLAISDL